MTYQGKSSLLLLWAIVLIVVLSGVAPSQLRAQTDRAKTTATDSEKEKEAEQRKDLEKKKLALLHDLAASAWSLKLPENRLFIMAGAADLLWAVDEKRARTVYWDALSALSLMTSAARAPGQNISREERIKLLENYMSSFQLRQRLLLQVARKDPQLALEMLRATRLPVPRHLATEIQLPDDTQLEQGIATEVAARDPEHALQLARQSLAKGLRFDVLNFVHRLNQVDSEKASQFVGDIISKLRTLNVGSDYVASMIALQLLYAGRTPDAEDPVRRTAAPEKNLRLSDEQKRELAELLADAALSASAGPDILRQISGAMPYIERYFPERRAAIERKVASSNQTLHTAELKVMDYNSAIARGSMEDVVRLAASADDQTRLALYRQAALISISRGQTESFRELVNKQVKSADERASIFDALDAEEISTAAGRKDLDQLRKLVPGIRRKEERARAMAELAMMLKEKGEDLEAVALLDDAATLIKTDLKDEAQTNALLALLCAYALVDPPKAFAMIERTLDRANSQISLLLLVDKVIKSGAIKKGEILLEYRGIMPLDYILFKFGKGVNALAKADFNRTRALAERFERNELKLMAQLFILQGMAKAHNSLGEQRDLH
jgi:hypothetical protein